MSKIDTNHFREDVGGFLLCKWCQKDIDWVQDVGHAEDCIVTQLAQVEAERDALAAVIKKARELYYSQDGCCVADGMLNILDELLEQEGTSNEQ